MLVSERLVAIVTLALIAVSALFCIIGLATNGWYSASFGSSLFGSGSVSVSYGLFTDGSPAAPKGLSIISFLLLLACIAVIILQILGKLRSFLRYLPIAIMSVATIFLLATFASSGIYFFGYSFNLMVVAHFFSYVALVITAYLLGQADGAASPTAG